MQRPSYSMVGICENSEKSNAAAKPLWSKHGHVTELGKYLKIKPQGINLSKQRLSFTVTDPEILSPACNPKPLEKWMIKR